jgi:type I restriction enzyme M protein
MHVRDLARYSDPFGRYYTDSRVARVLVESMSLGNPKLVIELGAGNGVLVREASRYWASTEFITVDIDGDTEIASILNHQGAAFTHYIHDALDVSLSDRIGVPHGTVDSALCNPPYIQPQWRTSFSEILEDAGLSGVIPKISATPADVLFMAQNMRFLRDGGKLGLILPDGIIAGERYARLRQALISSHRIERIIELPRGIFRKTDAKAHIIVLVKNGNSSDFIRVQGLDLNGALANPLWISPDDAGDRLDFSYLRFKSRLLHRESELTLGTATQVLARGIYSSSKRKGINFPVFHTTDFVEGSTTVPEKFSLSLLAQSEAKGILAQPGDILVARVGRNLHRKVAVVSNGIVAVTDCIFILRVAEKWRQRALVSLTSMDGRASLAAISHGIGATFITGDSLLKLSI